MMHLNAAAFLDITEGADFSQKNADVSRTQGAYCFRICVTDSWEGIFLPQPLISVSSPEKTHPE